MFAERVWCLRQLARTLRERHGVEAHVADGQRQAARVRGAQAPVHRGEFPVLCLSRIGAEGHNLQNASVLVSPRSAVAAVGARAARRPRRTPGRRPRLGADLHPLHPRRAASSTSSRSSPRAAPSTTPSSTLRGRPRRQIDGRHPARARSPARSPTPSRTPATPPPPRASGSPPACSGVREACSEHLTRGPDLNGPPGPPPHTDHVKKGGRA